MAKFHAVVVRREIWRQPHAEPQCFAHRRFGVIFGAGGGRQTAKLHVVAVLREADGAERVVDWFAQRDREPKDVFGLMRATLFDEQPAQRRTGVGEAVFRLAG